MSRARECDYHFHELDGQSDIRTIFSTGTKLVRVQVLLRLLRLQHRGYALLLVLLPRNEGPQPRADGPGLRRPADTARSARPRCGGSGDPERRKASYRSPQIKVSGLNFAKVGNVEKRKQL